MATKKQVLDVYFVTNSNYTVREEEYNGKPHIVVPVTMMVEGVHSGSHGPILHLAEELGRYPQSWDGIPVTIGHPIVNGTYVSANSPDVLHDWAVGQIFNTHMDASGKLQAEAYICVEDLERVSEDTLEMITNGEIVEVSVGIFSDEEVESGTWNTENYNATARNYRPNHLALLPDDTGACSIENGCGVRVNKKGGTKVTKKKIIVNAENQAQALKELNREGFSVNEVGFGELQGKIATAVYRLDGNGADNYIEEIYSDYFVYRQYNTRVTPREQKMYKQSYSVDEANEVVLSGDAVQVKREVSYDPIPNVNKGKAKRRNELNNNNSMCTPCVKKLVDGLIANKTTAWSKEDRETLEAMEEATLEKMTPQTETPQANVEVKLTREAVIGVFAEKPMTTEEALSFTSPEAASHIREGLALRTNQKNEMIESITNNSKVYTKEELEAKDFNEIVKINKLAGAGSQGEEVVFAGAGGIGGETKVQTNAKTGPKVKMLPNGINFKKDSK